jgi:copper chaperone CopZ
MDEKTYTIEGMTCDHCVQAVTDELMTVSGVDIVEIDLGNGRVRVTGENFTDEQVRAAVDEAGYALVDA